MVAISWAVLHCPISIIRVSIGDTLRVAIRVYVLGAGSLGL